MNSTNVDRVPLIEVRSDFIHQDRYLSREFAELERNRLWTKTWQWACRLEELPDVGSFVVYDIADQSVIVMRSSDTQIKAFHNVCPHRGRRLLSGSGRVNKIHCIFHAWQWDLKGESTRVVDQEQWQDCPGMTSDDLHLVDVGVAQWAGFIFINMSEAPEPFDAFISPAPKYLDVLRMDKMRYTWRKAVAVDCNWKAAQEAFMESYHLWGTHPQFLPLIDEKNISQAQGKHGNHIYLSETPPGVPSHRLNLPEPDVDKIRETFSAFIGVFGEQLGDENGNGQMTARSIRAGCEALASLPSGTSVNESMGAAIMAMKEAADADNAFFPMPDPEHRATMGDDWNIFPTMSIVHGFDGTLIMRARPRGEDPNKCTLELISLCHWGEGKEPKVEVDVLDDWINQTDQIPSLLVQDLRNLVDVQKGMHSVGLKGLRPNPVQEVQISHFHEVINSYVFGSEV